MAALVVLELLLTTPPSTDPHLPGNHPFSPSLVVLLLHPVYNIGCGWSWEGGLLTAGLVIDSNSFLTVSSESLKDQSVKIENCDTSVVEAETVLLIF